MSTRRGDPADLSAFSELAPELAEMLVAVACDIALVIDDEGVIRNVAVGSAQTDRPDVQAWVGCRWSETVTAETRRKVEELLVDLDTSGMSRQRLFTHASAAGSELPVAYTAVRLGERGLTLAVGRDLRLVTALQDSLLDAQQAIERDYWIRRRADTRNRALFESAGEAVLMLDATTFDIVDANEGAAQLLRLPSRRLIGVPIHAAVDPGSHGVLGAVLDGAASAVHAPQRPIQLAGAEGFIGITAQPYDAASGNLLMLRMSAPMLPTADGPRATRHEILMAELAERTSDAIAICATNGRLIHANAAFRELVGRTSDSSLDGTPLATWLRITHMSLRDFLQAIRLDGECALLRAQVRRWKDWTVEIELSASLLDQGQAIGFVMRVAHEPHVIDAAVDDRRDRNVH